MALGWVNIEIIWTDSITDDENDHKRVFGDFLKEQN